MRLGIIGLGNMGGAILNGIMNAHYIPASQIVYYDTNSLKMKQTGEKYPSALPADNYAKIAAHADMILLAVKPIYLGGVINGLKPYLNGKSIISIAAGWTVSMLADALKDTGALYLRVMPNTPAMIGQGMTAICEETTFGTDEFEFAKGIFDSVGKTTVLPERLFDGVIAISGSSPAYVYMFIEAMADAGVREGIPRSDAYVLAAQAVLGSAMMVLQTDLHPGALKDAVCSPAGTTIEAVAALEKNGFRSAVMEAMSVCAEKSRQMSKK